MQCFDALLGMDFLSTYLVKLDCHEKVTIFQPSNMPAFKFKGVRRNVKTSLVSALKADRLLHKGSEGCLAVLLGPEKTDRKLEELPVAKEFSDVFPDDLPRLPSNRVVNFSIKSLPGTTPISKAPYRMAKQN